MLPAKEQIQKVLTDGEPITLPAEPASQAIVDVIFPILHGTYGEDGTMQGFLELANVPYVGAGDLGCAIGMDKAVIKRLHTEAWLPAVSLPGEILTSREFYDYKAKYIDEDSRLLIPAPLEAIQTNDAQRLAVAAFKVLECSGMARVDLFLERVTGKFYVNEINTLPG